MSKTYTEDHIRTLDAYEHIRQHPGYYIKAPTLPASQAQIFKEILDNATDEAPFMPGKTIEIVFFRHKGSYQVMVVDQGRGIPLGKLVDVFTKLNTSGKGSGAYNAAKGVFGVGAKATAALSKRFVAITKRTNGIGCLELNAGMVKRHDVIVPRGSDTGTTVFYEPDATIFSGIPEFLAGEGFQEIISLLNFNQTFTQSLRIHTAIVDGRIPDKLFNESVEVILATLHGYIGTGVSVMTNATTPLEYVRQIKRMPNEVTWDLGLEKTMDHDDPNSTVGYDVHLYLTNPMNAGGIVGAVNMTPIDHYTSSHIEGLMNAVKAKIADRFDGEIKSFFENVYRPPFYGWILAKARGVTFVNQTKDEFHKTDFAMQYVIMLRKQMLAYDERYWSRLYELIVTDVIEKYARYANKQMGLGKGLKNIGFTLNNPDCYVGCKSSDNRITELLIAEGDSAGDAVQQIRDTNTQAVFKLRGKPKNLVQCTMDTSMVNKIVQDLIKILGVGPNDTTLENLNFRRIIILTDADSDGYHIAALLIGGLYRINPLIITEGRVCIANPPLYVLATGANALFLRDHLALIDTRVTGIYYRALALTMENPATGQRWALFNDHPDADAPSGFRDFCYLVLRIGGIINTVANLLVVSPMLLEQLVILHQYLDPLDPDALRRLLQCDYVVHHQESDSLVLSASDEEVHVPLTNLLQEIKQYILPIYQRYNFDQLMCRVTTRFTNLYVDQPTTYVGLYEIFMTLDRQFPVHRIKGLGELDMPDLRLTCVDPLTRTLTVVHELGELDKLYAMLDADPTQRKKLLKDNEDM